MRNTTMTLFVFALGVGVGIGAYLPLRVGLSKLLGKSEKALPKHDVSFILYVADQDAATAFYRAALAAVPSLQVPGMTQFTLPGGHTLGLMPEAGIAKLFEGSPKAPNTGDARVSRAELYLHVEDPAAAHARALAAGAQELSPLAPRGWGDEAAYSRDLDGHVLVFARPL